MVKFALCHRAGPGTQPAAGCWWAHMVLPCSIDGERGSLTASAPRSFAPKDLSRRGRAARSRRAVPRLWGRLACRPRRLGAPAHVPPTPCVLLG
eukprot:414300-Prymnesium_polylepis.1